MNSNLGPFPWGGDPVFDNPAPGLVRKEQKKRGISIKPIKASIAYEVWQYQPPHALRGASLGTDFSPPPASTSAAKTLELAIRFGEFMEHEFGHTPLFPSESGGVICETSVDVPQVPTNRVCASWHPIERIAFFGSGKPPMLLPAGEAIEVVGHELTHGIVQHLWNPRTSGQSASVVEHLCDVFGVMARQWDYYEQHGALPQDPWVLCKGLYPTSPPPGSTYQRDMEIGRVLLNNTDDDVYGPLPTPASVHSLESAIKPSNVSDHAWTWILVYARSGLMNRAFSLACNKLGELPWKTYGYAWYMLLKQRHVQWRNGNRKVARTLNHSCGMQEFIHASLVAARAFISTKAAVVLHETWNELGGDHHTAVWGKERFV